MMNSAIDRWALSSYSNKENASQSSNSKDSKNKRKPLSQKQQEGTEKPDSKFRRKSSNGVKKSFSIGGSGNSSKRQSAPASLLLGVGVEMDNVLPPDVNMDDVLPPPSPPVHNVISSQYFDENEVSTLAGDTFAGIEMDARAAEAVPPYHVNVPESPYDSAYDMPPIPLAPGAYGDAVEDAMITPTYSVLRKHKKRISRAFLPDDDETKPESPDQNDDGDSYGFGDDNEFAMAEEGKSKKNKSFYSNDDDEDDEDKPSLTNFQGDKEMESKESSPKKRQFRCVMCIGISLGVIMLLGIAALGYTLYAIRHEDQGALSLFSKEFWKNAGEKLAFWKKDKDNSAGEEYDEDFSGTIAPTIWSSTSTSTIAPTVPGIDTNILLSPKMEDLRSIVLSAAIEKSIDGTAMNDPASLQYSVLEWLSNDPRFDSYSNERVLQRYALGCFYKGLLGEEEGDIDSSKVNANVVRETWMSYDHECFGWVSTEGTKSNNNGNQPCNEAGQILSIHLEDVAFTGTLAPELALLSDSLESLYLTKNKIQGTIPTDYGKLTNLKRLQLSRNSLEGTLNGPEFLGPLEKLEIIGLGGNNLSGPLPKELGSMPSLVYLNMPYNDFTGSIPSSWSSNFNHVSFAMNNLTGTIPTELTSIEKLNNLLLNGNELQGSVSPSVCSGPFNNVTYNGMKMKVNCESILCSCCGCDGVTPPASALVEGVVVDSRFDNSNTTVVSNTSEGSEGNFWGSVATPYEPETVDTVTTENVKPEAEGIVSQTDSVAPEIVESVNNATPDKTNPEEPLNDTSIENAVPKKDSSEPVNSESSATTDSSEISQSVVSFPTLPPQTFPFVDDAAMEEAIALLSRSSQALEDSYDYGCQTIGVGFECYSPGYSIDFELSNNACGSPQSPVPPATQDYDLVALFDFDGNINRPRVSSSIGKTKSLSDAIYWATSCGLAQCDGVIANGQVYYRNTYPKMSAPIPTTWWPVTPGTRMQVLWMRADSSGKAVVLAESQPFIVSNRCR